MSNVAVYDGGAAAPYVGESDGVVTHSGVASPTITSEDRAIIAEAGNVFAAHGLDKQRSMQAAEKFYGDLMANQARGDDNDRKQVRTQMQKEWGGNYGANVKRIKSFIDTLPLSVQDVLWEGRTADNTLALNDVSVLRWLLRLSQPAGAYPGNADAEKREIEALMRKPGSRYWKGPEAESIQARYRELISSRG